MISPQLEPSGTKPQPGRSRMEMLPQELLDMLASMLDYSALLALRWSSRSLHGLLPHPSSPQAAFLRSMNPEVLGSRSRLSQLLHMEIWPCYHAWYACHRCRKLLPVGAFAVGMTSHRKAKDRDGAATRFCIRCGLDKGAYKRGDLLRIAFVADDKSAEDKETAIVCKRCGKVKLVKPDSSACLRRKCDECLRYRPP